jgi:DedD protein
MSDEGFHEIQLNGKQLVFLFMAATVVSVVIFLCGVMVGRGVRAERGVANAEALVGSAGQPPPAPEPAPPPADPAPAPGANKPGGAPAPDDTGYYKELVGETPADKASPKAPAVRPAESPAKAAPAAAPPVPAAAAPEPPKAIAADKGPTDGGFAVQIAALRDRSDADAIVKRLTGKGYAAYLLVPQPGSPPVYRVQVGRFTNRADAEKTAARLKKEEQFSPWVTR